MLQVQKVSTDWANGIPSGLTWYIIGQPKTGKTTQASKWSPNGQEGVLIIDTDLGADFVDGANVVTVNELNPPTRVKTKDGVKIMKDGKEQVELIPPDDRGFYHRSGPNKGKPMPVYSLAEVVADLMQNWDKYSYDTVVLDTLDQVNEWIEQTVTKEMNIDNMGDGQWGSDWAMARKRNLDIVKKLQTFLKKVGGNLVLTSHAKHSMVIDDKVQLAPSLPGGLGRSICAKADAIGYATVGKEKEGYIISFRGYDERMIGSRLRPLAQKQIPFSYEEVIKEINAYKEGE